MLTLTSYRTAPNAAKSDLKRQLKNFKVRPAIEQAIVKALAPTAGDRSETPAEPRPNLTASASAHAAERPTTPMLPKGDSVEPMYVNTQRELDDIIRDMHQHFDGRETEQNWLKREESIITLRRLIAGNAVSDFHDAFVTGVRGLLDGIIKGITTLRTSLAKESCTLVQDMANALGTSIDPMVELLMQTLLKLSASTKKIASQLANTTIDIILSRATFNSRLLQHVSFASQDKNVQPRLYASGWLKTLILKEEQHKAHIEHTGGIELIEKAIKKGLADANPGVREQMRATYWLYARIWPARAEVYVYDPGHSRVLLVANLKQNNGEPRCHGAEAPTKGPEQSERPAEGRRAGHPAAVRAIEEHRRTKQALSEGYGVGAEEGRAGREEAPLAARVGNVGLRAR